MPDPARLTSLTISGLRGILQTLTLEFYKPMTLVYGENGTGKTSICDALDLLGNGKCGSLDDISVGHGKHQHWPHLGQRPTDISVNLNAADGTAWSATVNGSRACVTSNNSSDAPAIKIWRRKQLMDLILSTPADRFKVIEPFIDIRKIAQSESALRNLLETTNRNINTASIRVSESLETLRGQQELAGNESGDTLAWAREENWKGGGGFRYYRLAPSLLEKDPWGNWVINEKYNSEMLAEAICKHEGFTYSPSETVYWQHGHSTERDYIYVTTQTLSRAQLDALSEEVGDERTLLICCGAFRVKRDAFANLTLKKIPNAVLNRCEFGRDDYSLELSNLPEASVPEGTQAILFAEEET
jgi:hypothetical protein